MGAGGGVMQQYQHFQVGFRLMPEEASRQVEIMIGARKIRVKTRRESGGRVWTCVHELLPYSEDPFEIPGWDLT
jgi:hypothetical protein